MYISRPLPHLIGSAEFFSDDLLGLVENDGQYFFKIYTLLFKYLYLQQIYSIST